MTTVFYTLAIFFIVGEVNVLLDSKFCNTGKFIIFQLLYTLWAIIGLFTDSWMMFTVLLSLGLCSGLFFKAFITGDPKDSPYKRQIMIVDSIVSILILSCILIKNF